MTPPAATRERASGRWAATAWLVFTKELRDALRDRRTLWVVLLSSVALAPLLLVALSALVADLEEGASTQLLHAQGLEQAPTLANYIARQGWTVQAVEPTGRPLQSADLSDHPVLVVPADFERQLAAGLPAALVLATAGGNQRVETRAAALARLVAGFQQEQATLRLALRGVPAPALQVIDLQWQDLAGPQGSAARLMRMLPFFMLMAVVYGALHAALDSTAGERERGSLEPLLTTPAPRAALVLGKWGAVAAVGMAVAVLASASFVPAQWLLRSPTLAALFHYGLREAALCIALLLPVAGLVAALLMAVAARCRSFREAQASTAVVVMAVSMLPVVSAFNPGTEQPWQLWVPVLAQASQMQRVLAGEAIGAAALLLPLAAAAVATLACLLDVARQLRLAAAR